MTCPNGVAPLQLPIANYSVTQDGVGITRGIELGIGTPQQAFSLFPGASFQNVFAFNSADCGNASNDSCIAIKGGVFSSKASSSFVQSIRTQWNGTQEDDEGADIYFNDVLSYGSTGQSPGFPIIMNWPGYSKSPICLLCMTIAKVVKMGKQSFQSAETPRSSKPPTKKSRLPAKYGDCGWDPNPSMRL